ncbi:hypothetical protein [Citricoccus sp. CH26A]|uniref:hypothetical protein n=1 Tax=Citricoccus sp. CH26A TaxID=1045009 RepID=UPI000308D312|nr:hypothetical protein [Citricoccus sp. CH26A]
MITLTPPSTPFDGPPTDHPLILFPVRIETRFRVEAGTPSLLVRVYVEDLAVEWHQPGLTESEDAWGRAFWQQVWRSGPNAPRREAAWTQLTERFGPPRAAYIAEALQPTNYASRPGTETGVDDELPILPTFPKTPQTSQARRPQTRVLPDRWIATGWIGDERVFAWSGEQIAEDAVAVGPGSEASGFDATTLARDPELAWLVDFEAAVSNGMGLRIPYTLPAETRLDRLVVFGARNTEAAQGAERIAELLHAHRYTDGLAFVSQSTPTNNTDEAPSGMDSSEHDYGTHPPTAEAPPFPAGEGSNREVMAQVLGIDHRLLDRIPGATAQEQRDAYHMNTLVWKATLGYSLDHYLAGPGSPSIDTTRMVREHFASFVRGRGPLPAIRVGHQPYGVLPAISLDRWQPLEAGTIDAALHRFLLKARELWRGGLDAVPRAPLSPEPSAELLRVLAMSPGAVGYATRNATRLGQLASDPATPFAAHTGSNRARELAQALGITWTPRGIRTLWGVQPQGRFTAGIVQERDNGIELLSEREPLTSNYLRTMASEAYRALPGLVEELAPSPLPSHSLLELLVRHAEQHEYLDAAYRILARRNEVTEEERREPDVADGNKSPVRNLLTRPIVHGGSNQQIGGFLDDLRTVLAQEGDRDITVPGAIWRRRLYEAGPGKGGDPDVAPDVAELGAFVRAVAYLAERPSASLSQTLRETLDLSSYRLDAWATSLATKRLEWLRGRNPNGVYVGCYGWVEDLAPTPRTQAPAPTIDTALELPPQLAPPLYTSAGSRGYVHAPSLAHGTTAAILRSGYLARQAPNDRAALAVNLSSARVRSAKWLIDGVRDGQSLSSLLGYRFERALHENHPALVLDQYILSFRRIASPAAAVPAQDVEAWAAALEQAPAPSVADGLTLLKKYRQPDDSPQRLPWGTSDLLPAPGTAAYEACIRELDALEDVLDAVADLALAESVHHVAQGNPVRAGATLEAIAQGEAPPPDIEVIRTPRTGIGITHRVLVLMDGSRLGPVWGPSTPRAVAEPYLNAWIAYLLGPQAARARCKVELHSGERAPSTVEVLLEDIGVAPIDLIQRPDQQGTHESSELEYRVIRHVLDSDPPADADDDDTQLEVRLHFGRQPEWDADSLSFTEVLEAVRSIKDTIHGARALSPTDLALPETAIPQTAETEPPGTLESLLLSSRAIAAAAGLDQATKELGDLIGSTNPEPRSGPLRQALLNLCSYGLTSATPVEPTGDSERIRANLTNQAQALVREATKRLEALRAIDLAYAQREAEVAAEEPGKQLPPRETRAWHIDRLAKIFGPELQILPPFVAVNGPDLGNTLAANTALQDGNPVEVATWLQRTARVRNRTSRLHRTMVHAEALGGASLSLAVGQLPHTPGDRWLGLPLPARQSTAEPPPRPPGGRLSLIVHTHDKVDPEKPVAGLLIDEWTETIPSPEETTGLVFHYDQPTARAPKPFCWQCPRTTATRGISKPWKPPSAKPSTSPSSEPLTSPPYPMSHHSCPPSTSPKATMTTP